MNPSPTEQARQDKLLRLKKRLFLVGCIGVVCVLLTFFGYALKFQNGISSNHAEWGTFGDFFGGLLNPLLSLLGLLALLGTIVIQMEELNNSREELEKSTRAMNEQAGTSAKQLLESTFFHMIRLHNAIVQDITIGSKDGRHALQILKRRFEEKWSRWKNYDMVEQKALVKIYEQFYKEDGDKLGHYFRNMYQVARFVHESDLEDKRMHFDLLRAQLSRDEQLLLFLNVVAGPGRDKFKPLVEDYGLLEHLPQADLLVSKPLDYISASAFVG